MADKKVTQLTDLGDGLAAVDLFHVVDDPSGTPINKKIAAEDVFNNIPSWLGLNSTSQSITGDGSTSSAIDVTTPVTEVLPGKYYPDSEIFQCKEMSICPFFLQ